MFEFHEGHIYARTPALARTERRPRDTTQLRCRRRLLLHVEQPEQLAQGLGLHCPRMRGEKVVAEEALLFVTDPVGVENLLRTLDANDHQASPIRLSARIKPTWRLCEIAVTAIVSAEAPRASPTHQAVQSPSP